jgi:hypothetical protein
MIDVTTVAEKFIHWDDNTAAFAGKELTGTLNFESGINANEDKHLYMLVFDLKFRMYLPTNDKNAIFSCIFQAKYQIRFAAGQTTVSDIEQLIIRANKAFAENFDNRKADNGIIRTVPAPYLEKAQVERLSQELFHDKLQQRGLV